VRRSKPEQGAELIAGHDIGSSPHAWEAYREEQAATLEFSAGLVFFGVVEWTDEAILLSVRPLGETGVVAEVLSRHHGRHMGLVYGGNSRRLAGILQAGNSVKATWRARLAEHLGNFHFEIENSRAVELMEKPLKLAGVQAAAGVLSAALPEREAHEPIFQSLGALLDAGENLSPLEWAAMYVAWESGLLRELGFGMDLSQCASTGTANDLAYVSPRTGRAVSRLAGEPYADKMLKLPLFLLSREEGDVTTEDVLDGLKLTGFFLERHAFHPHNKPTPPPRMRFAEMVAHSKHAGGAESAS
jgi:DNA repair protein RecO (recombination protein O)